MTTPESITSFLVKEGRRNERMQTSQDGANHWGEKVGPLLKSLVGQTPNRMYCSDDGRIVRAVMYSDSEEGFPFSAYWEMLENKSGTGEKWEVKRREFLIGTDREAIDYEIRRIRGRFELRRDLLAQPDEVVLVENSPNGHSVGDFIHTVNSPRGPFSYRYSLSPLGPRSVGLYLNRSMDEITTGEQVSILSSPPKGILEHSDPFQDSTS